MGLLRTVFHILTFGIVDSNQEVERKNTPCNFTEKFSQQDFENIAIKVAKPIKRLTVTVNNEFVIGKVRTSSGINTWEFILDFNDYGKITGEYWIKYNENHDSQIPGSYAEQLKSAVKDYLRLV